MAKKIGQNGDGERRSNFGLKLNVHVQYNVEANMARSCRLTCLKMEGNNLLKKSRF